MTAQQIANRVKEVADARFNEVIERLLRLLDARSDIPHLIWKWNQTGLLEDVLEKDKGDASYALETACLELIDQAVATGDTSWERNGDIVVARFREALAPYRYDR